MWIIYFVNGAQFLNGTSLFAWPPEAFTSSVTRIYNNHKDLIFSLKINARTILPVSYNARTISCLCHNLCRFDCGWHNTFLLKFWVIHCQSCLIRLHFFGFPFYMVCIIKLNQTTITAFWESSRVFSSDSLIIKNTDTLSL